MVIKITDFCSELCGVVLYTIGKNKIKKINTFFEAHFGYFFVQKKINNKLYSVDNLFLLLQRIFYRSRHLPVYA
jgi:hypothetical protein